MHSSALWVRLLTSSAFVVSPTATGRCHHIARDRHDLNHDINLFPVAGEDEPAKQILMLLGNNVLVPTRVHFPLLLVAIAAIDAVEDESIRTTANNWCIACRALQRPGACRFPSR